MKNKIKILIVIMIICVSLISIVLIELFAQSTDVELEYRSGKLISHPYDDNDIEILINNYPEFKKEYNITKNSCSKCHKFSRALNSPYIGKQWDYTISRMILKNDSKISAYYGKMITEFMKMYSKEKITNPNKIILNNKKSNSVTYEYLINIIKKSKEELNNTYGKILFKNNCSICHGDNGKDEKFTPQLNNISSIKIFLNDDAKYYKQTIKAGRKGTLMKGWGEEYLGPFNSTQINSIIEHIKIDWYSTQTGHTNSIDFQKYELLVSSSINEGEYLFNNICINCHQPHSTTITAPDIRNYSLIGNDPSGDEIAINNDQIRYIVKNGINNTKMSAFGENKNGIFELSDSQVDSIIKYLRNRPVIYK